MLENVCHEQLGQREIRRQGNFFSTSVNLNSKMSWGQGVDHAEKQLGTEKDQGVIFRAQARADHPGVTKGREEEG